MSMERLTKRAFDAVVYVGPDAQYQSTGDTAAEMSPQEIRNALKRLADYEDTGLTPEQIMELKDEVGRIYTALV